MTSLSNAKAEVYVETSTNVFSYQGSVEYEHSINATVDTNNSVWVLVTPSSSNAYASMTALASPYGSTSSSSSNSDGTVVAIVVGTICGLLCLGLIIGAIVWCLLIKRHRNNKRNQSDGRYIGNQAPVINNYLYQVQSPNYTHPTEGANASPSYPTSEVFTGQPVSMNGNLRSAKTPAHSDPSHPVYISKEVGVPFNKV